MEALDVKMRIAAGEPALRAWLQFAVGAQEAPEDDEGFDAQRPVPHRRTPRASSW